MVDVQDQLWKCGRCNGTGRSTAGTSETTCPDCRGTGFIKI